ncbi:unnamed protein product, partial [Cladocopium goreaui]
ARYLKKYVLAMFRESQEEKRNALSPVVVRTAPWDIMERLGDLEPLVDALPNADAAQLRSCSRSLRALGRQPQTGRVQCHAVHCRKSQLQPLLEGGQIWWERLVTLDLANTLQLGSSGLRDGLCRSWAEEDAIWIEADDLTGMLTQIFQDLKVLRRLSIAISFEDHRQGKLSAPNCLQEVGSLKTLREVYVATDHLCLEVALLGALAQLGALQKLWLHLGSMQYNEAVSAALVARLPSDLEVLSIWGTTRLLRDVLSALGPKGKKRMPKLKELDLSMHAPGEIPSDHVWAVLRSGAPGLRAFCLCGALAWYPAVSDAWFLQLISAVQSGHGRCLKLLDLRRNKLRADVADRLQEKMWKVHRKDFQLLWDGSTAGHADGSAPAARMRVVASRKKKTRGAAAASVV